MKIYYKTRKLQKNCTIEKQMNRKFGTQTAKILGKRLAQLEAVDTFEDMRSIPGVKCHELSGNRAGQLAVHLNQPYRLVFIPNNELAPQKPKYGLDWSEVTDILITDIIDYH